LGDPSFTQESPKQAAEKDDRYEEKRVGSTKNEHADGEADEYAHEHVWQSNRYPVVHPKPPIVREPGGLHLLEVENRLALLFHLSCQP